MKPKINKQLLSVTLVLLLNTISRYVGVGKNGKSKGSSQGKDFVLEEKEAKVTSGFTTPNLPYPSNCMIANCTLNDCPLSLDLWNGAPSALSIYSIQSYFYLLTIKSDCKDPENTSYTYEREYVWNYGNTVTNFNNMKIPLPSNTHYSISVEYWEQCGPYWGRNYNKKRGVSAATLKLFYGNTNIFISNSDFYFLKATN